MDKWKKVGTFTKQDISGNKMLVKLHQLLRKLSPKATSITDFAVCNVTGDYLEARIRRLHGQSAGFISLQFTPCYIEEGEPFTVYRRVKSRKEK